MTSERLRAAGTWRSGFPSQVVLQCQIASKRYGKHDSPKDEYTVKLEDPEKEWWAGTELGLLRAYHFPGHVTVSDGSVRSDCMGAGFTWMDSSLKRYDSERIGRDEEETNSGRSELGGYTAILKLTPDTQDLVTVTDSEVLYRLVR